jgi:hypothetical protein
MLIMEYTDDRECIKPYPPVFVMYQLEILSKMSLSENQLKRLAELQAECLKAIMQAQADYFGRINEVLNMK